MLGTLLFAINTYSLEQPFVEIFVHFKLPCSLFSKKNPVIRIFSISGYLAVPIYPDKCILSFFFTALLKPMPPHCWCFEITHIHTILGRIPLDEESARRRDLYLTAHNIYKRQTPMAQVLFEPTIPAYERPHTYALDRAAPGIGMKFVLENGNVTQNFGLITEGRKSLKRCTCRWEDNIKMNHADTWCEGVNWSEIHQNGIQLWPVWTP